MTFLDLLLRIRRAVSRDRQPPPDMDPECVELCRAMNALPGITTTESCSGHGEFPYRVFFHADNLRCLPALLYWFDGCHCGFYGWQVTVATDCAMSPVYFCVEGPTGDAAYSESKEIAQLIVDYGPQEAKAAKMSRRRRRMMPNKARHVVPKAAEFFIRLIQDTEDDHRNDLP